MNSFIVGDTIGSSYGKHETFHQDLGCVAKISKFANVQCPKVCSSSVHCELKDMLADLEDYNQDKAHYQFLSSSPTFKLLAHSFCAQYGKIILKYSTNSSKTSIHVL